MREWALDSRNRYCRTAKISAVQESESWKGRNNSFCPYCRKLYMNPEGVGKRACAPPYCPRRAIFSYVLGVAHMHCFHRVPQCIRPHFRPPKLQLRSRYRSIVARAPKMQGRSSSLHGSDLKKLVQCCGLDARTQSLHH